MPTESNGMRILILIVISILGADCCAQSRAANFATKNFQDQNFQDRNHQDHLLSSLAEKKVAKAGDLLRRGAVWSAREQSVEAMQLLASSQDQVARVKAHSSSLSMAFDALREAEDFVDRALDTAALQRVIEAHETPALKEGASRVLSGVDAHQVYLRFAASNFQKALGQPRVALLGSRVLYLYGRSILLAKDSKEWHAHAAAKSLFGVAIAIDPDNAIAQRELGIQLLEVGDSQAATLHLVKSSTLAPTRRGYEFLRRAAKAENLPKVVAISESRIAKGEYQPAIKVLSLSPAEFAATHDLVASSNERQSDNQTNTKVEKRSDVGSTDHPRVSTGQTIKKILGLVR